MLSEFFVTQDHSLTEMLAHSYNLWLVFLSYAVSVFAAYTSFQLLERVIAAPNRLVRLNWLVTGSVSMGCGIWSMHFVAMLAVEINHEVRYDPALTVMSAVFAMLASGFAFNYVSKGTTQILRLVLAGTVLGAGIGAMHYTGMLAMRINAAIRYDPVLFGVSIVVAASLATLALRLMFFVNATALTSKTLILGATAAVMGLAITLMHYTGMAATHFLHSSIDHSAVHPALPGIDLSGSFVGFVVGGAAFIILGLAWLGANIDQRMQSKDAKLQQSQGMLQAIVDSALDGIIAFDTQGTVKSFNPAGEKIFAYSPDEVVGQNLSLLIPDAEILNQSSNFNLPGAAAAKHARHEPMHMVGLCKNGTEIQLEVSLSEMTVGGATMYTAIARNVTRRLQAEKERADLERSLHQAQKMESLGTLSGGIAHEINTPVQYVGDNIRFLQSAFSDLNGVLEAYRKLESATGTGEELEILRAQARAAAEAADLDYLSKEIPSSVGQSLDGIERIREIVQAIKEFSHPSAKEKLAIDINHAITTTMTVARNQWKYVADLETDFDASLPQVLCLPGEINQVFLNLIVNAAHAIADTGGDSRGRITVSTANRGDWAEIRISDTGVGIPPEHLPKVFDPFFTTKDPGRGTGQGLAISHNIVTKKHGGTITVESELGKGTTFVIRLPLNQSPLENAAA